MILGTYSVSISVKSFSLFYSSPNLFLDRGILFLQNPWRVPNPIDQGKCLKNSSLTSPTLERVKDTNVSSSVDLVPKIDSKFRNLYLNLKEMLFFIPLSPFHYNFILRPQICTQTYAANHILLFV